MKGYPGVYPVNGGQDKYDCVLSYAVDGKRYQESVRVTASSPEKAFAEKVVRLEAAGKRARAGAKYGTKNTNFMNLLKLWKDAEFSSFRPSTQQGYVNIINNMLIPYFGDMKVVRIKTSDLYNFVDNYRQENPKVSDVRHF